MRDYCYVYWSKCGEVPRTKVVIQAQNEDTAFMNFQQYLFEKYQNKRILAHEHIGDHDSAIHGYIAVSVNEPD